MDNSCKQTAYSLHDSIITVHTECGQWRASFPQEKSMCLAEGRVVMERNPGVNEHMQIVFTRLFFRRPRTRAWEQGYMFMLLDVMYFGTSYVQ